MRSSKCYGGPLSAPEADLPGKELQRRTKVPTARRDNAVEVAELACDGSMVFRPRASGRYSVPSYSSYSSLVALPSVVPSCWGNNVVALAFAGMELSRYQREGHGLEVTDAGAGARIRSLHLGNTGDWEPD